MSDPDQLLAGRCRLFGRDPCGPRKDPSDSDHSGPRGTDHEPTGGRAEPRCTGEGGEGPCRGTVVPSVRIQYHPRANPLFARGSVLKSPGATPIWSSLSACNRASIASIHPVTAYARAVTEGQILANRLVR